MAISKTSHFMYTQDHPRSSNAVHELRLRAGQWLRELRERRGLSQRELASRVGAEFYTVIAQFECGRGHIAPEYYPAWAEALGVEPDEFARKLRSFQEPETQDVAG